MEKLVTVLTAYAQQQVEAGADVIQIFDSWAGALSVDDYRQYCLGPTTELVQRVKNMGVPVIYFGVDTASLLPAMRETGADVLGLDWRIPLDEGRRILGPDTSPSRATSTPSPSSLHPTSSKPASATSSRSTTAAPATSSTSVTASFPAPP